MKCRRGRRGDKVGLEMSPVVVAETFPSLSLARIRQPFVLDQLYPEAFGHIRSHVEAW